MCVRLYPEIPVMIDVVSQLRYYQASNNHSSNVVVNVDVNKCLEIQKRINCSPALNIFTGPIDSYRNWDESDYVNYLNRVRYFIKQGNSNKYRLDIESVFNSKNIDDITKTDWERVLMNILLLDGAYSGKTFIRLKLLSE